MLVTFLFRIISTIFMILQGLWIIHLNMVEPLFQPKVFEIVLLILGFVVVFIAIWT